MQLPARCVARKMFSSFGVSPKEHTFWGRSQKKTCVFTMAEGCQMAKDKSLLYIYICICIHIPFLDTPYCIYIYIHLHIPIVVVAFIAVKLNNSQESFKSNSGFSIGWIRWETFPVKTSFMNSPSKFFGQVSLVKGICCHIPTVYITIF